jgi:hypothetical protein
VDSVLVSGITKFFEYEQNYFQELLQAISGVKKVVAKKRLFLVLTAPFHELSGFKPKGGHIFHHFANVIVAIKEDEAGRKRTYELVQHPFKAHAIEVEYLPRAPKRKVKQLGRFANIEKWL